MSEDNNNIEKNEHDESLNVNGIEQTKPEANCEETVTVPNANEKTLRKKVRISLKTYIVSTVAIVLATVMLTYAACSGIFQKKYASSFGDQSSFSDKPSESVTGVTGYSEVDAIDFLLERYFYGEAPKEEMSVESLKAYIAATGDIYAAYYTQEEIDASNADGAGKMQGIGINIINSTVEIGGKKYAVLKITNVMKDSPAQEAGLRAGDMIAYAGIGENRESIDFLGYDGAATKLKGLSGTTAEFTILRKQGDNYVEMPITATRREVITSSVYFRKSTLGEKIGVIKIDSFDLTTPSQFEEAVESLKTQGCDKFVLDLRYNPGGYLISVAAVLSYFLDEGDVYIRTEDKNGKMTQNVVGVVTKYSGDYEACNVSKEDIGKYKDLNMVILCNENTASAGELFTATFRDYELAKIVGTTTFGKGKMQTTYGLDIFGLEGAVKFTTHMYYSAKSEGYDGVGIKPDAGCEIELSEEAKTYNIYDLPDDKDNQLIEAIKHFK